MGQSVVKNPRRIFSQTSSSSASSGGGGVSIPTVANYASLPDPTTVAGEFRWVSTATGVYLVGLYYSDGISWSASEANEIIVVANYSALPAANTASGQFYWCSAAQGTSWLPGSFGGTYYSAGLYYSNGTTWEYLNVPYQATQAEVNAGINTDKFLTPSTFQNSEQLNNKVNKLSNGVYWLSGSPGAIGGFSIDATANLETHMFIDGSLTGSAWTFSTAGSPYNVDINDVNFTVGSTCRGVSYNYSSNLLTYLSDGIVTGTATPPLQLAALTNFANSLKNGYVRNCFVWKKVLNGTQRTSIFSNKGVSDSSVFIGADKAFARYENDSIANNGTISIWYDTSGNSNDATIIGYMVNPSYSYKETVNTIGAIVNGAATATPNDSDLVMSVESGVAKKNTWTQIKAFLKTYYDTVYQTIITYTSFGTFLHAATNKTTPVDADEVGIWNSVSGLYEKVSLTNFKAFSKAYTDQFYVQIASNTTIYYYRQLTSNTGLDWRDYNVLVGNCPPKNRLTNFLGWNPAAFSPYDSTNQVVESTNSGTTWVVSAGSPSGITRRHIGTYGKRADGKVWFFGGEPQTPSTAKEVWTFDGTTYTLITSDWGIGFVYLGGFVLHNDIPYLIGGDSNPFGTSTQVLGVYRWNDGTSQFAQVGSLPVGNYTACIVYSTGDSLVVCSGSKYLSTTPSEYNDKILRSTDNGANWTQIGTLPTEMKSLMGSGIKCYGKYFYLKGVNTSNTNAQGMWYTTDFLTWTETIGKPLASHARGMTVHNTELYGAFGNTLNDCWKIEEITFPYYVSPLLYDWWVNLIVKPSKSLMVKLNTFAQYLDAADKWNKISFVNIIRLMETEEQALRPLRTTSNRIAVNNGVTIDSTGAVGGSGKYIDLNWNPYIDGQADNIYKQNDSCVGVYLFSNIAENAFDFGNGVGSFETSIAGMWTDNKMYTCINSNLEQTVTTTDSLGYRAVTRTSSAGGNQILNNTVTAYLRTSTGLHNSDFYGCAVNGIASYSTKKQGAFFAGSSDLEPVMRQALMDLFA